MTADQQSRLQAAMNAPLPHCSGGSCRQGRAKCETPAACETWIEFTADEVEGGMRLAAFAAVALFLVAGLFAWFVFDNAPLIRLALGL